MPTANKKSWFGARSMALPHRVLQVVFPPTMPIQNLNPDVLMMEPAEDWYRCDAADLLRPPKIRWHLYPMRDESEPHCNTKVARFPPHSQFFATGDFGRRGIGGSRAIPNLSASLADRRSAPIATPLFLRE
jgi:hypothetical protein